VLAVLALAERARDAVDAQTAPGPRAIIALQTVGEQSARVCDGKRGRQRRRRGSPRSVQLCGDHRPRGILVAAVQADAAQARPGPWLDQRSHLDDAIAEDDRKVRDVAVQPHAEARGGDHERRQHDRRVRALRRLQGLARVDRSEAHRGEHRVQEHRAQVGGGGVVARSIHGDQRPGPISRLVIVWCGLRQQRGRDGIHHPSQQPGFCAGVFGDHVDRSRRHTDDERGEDALGRHRRRQRAHGVVDAQLDHVRTAPHDRDGGIEADRHAGIMARRDGSASRLSTGAIERPSCIRSSRTPC
jgi:hypothetical protein